MYFRFACVLWTYYKLTFQKKTPQIVLTLIRCVRKDRDLGRQTGECGGMGFTKIQGHKSVLKSTCYKVATLGWLKYVSVIWNEVRLYAQSEMGSRVISEAFRYMYTQDKPRARPYLERFFVQMPLKMLSTHCLPCHHIR